MANTNELHSHNSITSRDPARLDDPGRRVEAAHFEWAAQVTASKLSDACDACDAHRPL